MSFFANIGSYARAGFGLLLLAGSCLPTVALDPKDINWGGAGWFNFGRIGQSSDTTRGKELTGRGMFNSGVQISVKSSASERLEIEAGVGVNMGHFLAGNSEREGGYVPTMVSPFVSNAFFEYSFWNSETSKLSLRGGLFPYDYMLEAQNLGLYLLRGPVYPGYLLSGFETKHVLPVANTLGAQLRYLWGGLAQDFILTSETEFYPFYDFSPAYVATFQSGTAFRIGAGVNFYHLIPIDSKLTKDSAWFHVDTTSAIPDTTLISFAGTKVAAFFSFDLKALLGKVGDLGSEDLKLYGEIALIGLDNSTPYKEIYGDYRNRMPVMVGFNLPAFRLLDRLALEVEWYGARFRDNLAGFEHTAGNEVSPFPYEDPEYYDPNVSGDNWKWSVYGSRLIQNHVKVSFQVANDHFRPGIFAGYGDNAPPGTQAVTNSPKDWYWMSKVSFYF